VNVHTALVPVQAPAVQPPKVDPLAGAAVSVTEVPDGTSVEHVGGQLIPAGDEVTVPVPVPALVTVTVCGVGGGGAGVNDARASFAASAVNVHTGFVPVHAPAVQPPKVDSLAGVAVSVTELPTGTSVEQVGGQLIPAGDEVTVPEPSPPNTTEIGRVGDGGGALTPKDAVVLLAASAVNVQLGSVPVHTPVVQPTKVDPLAGAAVSVTSLPVGTSAEQVGGQLIPDGDEVTVPLPPPVVATEIVCVVGGGGVLSENDAVALWGASAVKVQLGSVPVHAPASQPPKVDPLAGAAVSVTEVPVGTSTEQVGGQLMPAGDEDTVPVPPPVVATVTFCVVGGGGVLANDAVALVAAMALNVQLGLVPVHAPAVQPPNVEPLAGVAVSVTCAPEGTWAEQVGGQLIPAGDDVTVPVPVPVLATETVWLVGTGPPVPAT
jgi:hypothetical protein